LKKDLWRTIGKYHPGFRDDRVVRCGSVLLGSLRAC